MDTDTERWVNQRLCYIWHCHALYPEERLPPPQATRVLEVQQAIWKDLEEDKPRQEADWT